MNTMRTVGLIALCPRTMEFADQTISLIVTAPPPFNEIALLAQGTSLPIFRRKRRYLSVS